jgi:hypothetical protein
MRSKNSPVAEALVNLLELFHGDKVARSPSEELGEYLVLSYEHDFDTIWDLYSEESGNLRKWLCSPHGEVAKTIILVWDGLPSPCKAIIDPAEYVTPYDWAIAFSYLAFSQRQKRRKQETTPNQTSLSRFKILIVDLMFERHTNTNGYRQLSAFGVSLPWIQVYQPVAVSLDEAAFYAKHLNRPAESDIINLNGNPTPLRPMLPPGFFGVKKLLEDTLSPDTVVSVSPFTIHSDHLRDLESLVAFWKNSLTSPGMRHHISNLIAPIILADGFGSSLGSKAKKEVIGHDPVIRSIRTLTRAIGLTMEDRSEYPGIESGIIESMDGMPDVFNCFNNIDFLLIDDQFSLGYNHIFACLLFGSRYSSVQAGPQQQAWECEARVGEFKWHLRCEGSAETILSVLKESGYIDHWDRPRLLKIPGDILITDLRLWTTELRQKAFLNELLDLCDLLGTERIEDKSFKKAYKRAKAIARDEKDSVSEIESLALFPLLLSHYDPSLPIVLFSSTHQRSVMEMVAHRPNIITEFAKPILSGYGSEESPSGFIKNLRSSVIKSFRLHESRAIWEQLVNADWHAEPVFEFVNWKDTVFLVHNYNDDRIKKRRKHPRNRINAGRSSPKLQGENLQMLLAAQYVHYIAKENYFDYITIPWEFLEGTLIPQKILSNPNNQNTCFDLPEDLDPRNYVASILKWLRNKKAHGHVRLSNNSSNIEAFKWGALLGFLILLDFIQAAETSNGLDLIGLFHRVEAYTKNQYPNLGNSKEGQLMPWNLSADPSVNWLDFVLFISSYAAKKAGDDMKTFLSERTISVIEYLAGMILQATPPISKAAGNGS